MSVDKERVKYEQKFLPLYNFIHAKTSRFKEKEAIFYNQNKISIFKGGELTKFAWNNKERVIALFPKIDKELLIVEEKDASNLFKILLDNKIIMRLERHPEDVVKRWPKRLILTKDQRVDAESFYTWNIKLRNKFTNAKMIIVLIILFMVFLYPIWPFAFKYAIFKISLYLSVFLLVILLGRLALYIALRLVGYSFWILPNLDDETLGFWATFRPFYSIESNSDGKLEILLRLVGVILLGFLINAVIQEPQVVTDISDASGQTIDDILEWGKLKLEGKVEPLHKRAIPDLSEILRQQDEETARLKLKLESEEEYSSEAHVQYEHNVEEQSVEEHEHGLQ